MSAVRSRQELLDALARGERFKFLHFWGHTPKQRGVVDHACFSQWWPGTFVVDGERFPSAEHYMMLGKARLFGDEEIAAQILTVPSPAQAKALGRKVRGFDPSRWDAHKFDLVVAGNVAKFGQDPALRAYLLGTGDRVLVEASPRDRIWGIGMSASHPDADRPQKWRGENLLGFALMVAREQLANEV